MAGCDRINLPPAPRHSHQHHVRHQLHDGLPAALHRTEAADEADRGTREAIQWENGVPGSP